MYKIKDIQFTDKYFASGTIFKDKKQVCEQLISYHSSDCNMEVEQKLFDTGDYNKCWEALSQFEWELIAICPKCQKEMIKHHKNLGYICNNCFIAMDNDNNIIENRG